MNTLLFDNSEKIGPGRVRIQGDRARHVCQVLKAQAGQRLRVGQINGLLGHGELIKIHGPTDLELHVELRANPPDPTPISVLLALPRPKVLGRKLKSLVELGVKNVHLINAEKVEPSYWTAHQLGLSHIDQQVRSGLSQVNDCLCPEIFQHRSFKMFIDEVLPSLLTTHQEAWLAHPKGEITQPIKPVGPGPYLLAIGPEGGWTPRELDIFRSNGFHLGHLGDRVLSTETAIVSLVTRLSHFETPTARP